jgi:hypothetical protein
MMVKVNMLHKTSMVLAKHGKRKQQVATMSQDFTNRYQRNSSNKSNQQGDCLHCDACLGGQGTCCRQGHAEIGLPSWAGKRTHPTDLSHAFLKATPRNTGSVPQTPYLHKQLLKDQSAFESWCNVHPNTQPDLGSGCKMSASMGSVSVHIGIYKFEDCQNSLAS